MTDESGRHRDSDSDRSEESSDRSRSESTADDTRADRVVVSYPADLSDWGLSKLEASSYRAYLGKAHDEARVGDVWEEFVDVGCCGSTMDVPLRVERIDGGARVDEETEIEYEPRETEEMEGSWQVQSEAGPKRA